MLPSPLLPGTCSPCVRLAPQAHARLVWSTPSDAAGPTPRALPAFAGIPPDLHTSQQSPPPTLMGWVCCRPGARVQSPTWHVPRLRAGLSPDLPTVPLFPEHSPWLPRLQEPRCNGLTLGHRVQEEGTAESLPSGHLTPPGTAWPF